MRDIRLTLVNTVEEERVLIDERTGEVIALVLIISAGKRLENFYEHQSCENYHRRGVFHTIRSIDAMYK